MRREAAGVCSAHRARGGTLAPHHRRALVYRQPVSASTSANYTEYWCALSVQIKELRRRHREEVTELKNALGVAQGENLALRRRLAACE